MGARALAIYDLSHTATSRRDAHHFPTSQSRQPPRVPDLDPGTLPRDDPVLLELCERPGDELAHVVRVFDRNRE